MLLDQSNSVTEIVVVSQTENLAAEEGQDQHSCLLCSSDFSFWFQMQIISVQDLRSICEDTRGLWDFGVTTWPVVDAPSSAFLSFFF